MSNALDIMKIDRPRMAIGNIIDHKESNIATQQHIESIDIINIENPIVVPWKRGRGRPRKYPIKGSTSVVIKPKKLVIQQLPRPIPDLLELTKESGMPSVWGNIKKGKRVCKFKWVHELKSEAAQSDSKFMKDQQLGTVKIEVTELRFPSSDVSECSTVSKSDCTSVGTDLMSDSDSRTYDELSWFARILIPGPIPDLEALFRDESLSNVSDFFADVPILEE